MKKYKFTFDPKQIATIEEELRQYVKEYKLNGFVLGVSGGIDSAVCLRLLVGAVGVEKVLAFWLPDGDQDKSMANIVANWAGVALVSRPIHDILDEAERSLVNPFTSLTRGNYASRTRMSMLYHYAHVQDRVVCNTSNLSEIMTGYFTKWGDSCGDISPIAEYFKTEVYLIAGAMGMPRQIIIQAPSAGFEPGQTDEQDLTMSYEKVDQNLIRKIKIDNVLEGVNKIEFRHINWLVRKNEHKTGPRVIKRYAPLDL